MNQALALETSPLIVALNRELAGDPASALSTRTAHAIPQHIWDRALGNPLREFLDRPGKAFRSELAKIFFGLVNRGVPPESLCSLLEGLHAGSLIVDDIEDESTERRGRPALHQLHGVPTALNAGNWLYFWAFELLAGLELRPDTHHAAHRMMTRALLDCHYGQALDLSVDVQELSPSDIPVLVRATTELKTGSLVALSAGLGALVGGADRGFVETAWRFGRELGTALQMLDDLSGVANPKKAHKGAEDLLKGRPTWPWAWLAASRPEELERLRSAARSIVTTRDAARLAAEMRDQLLPRARQCVHDHLDAAFECIAPMVPQGRALSALRREIERLERSYV